MTEPRPDNAEPVQCPACGSREARYQHCKIFCGRCGQIIMSCNETV